MHRFTAGWSNFATWAGDMSGIKLTRHQAKRLYLEHFARRLLLAHGRLDTFFCRPHPSVKELMSAVVDVIGKNGGALPNSLTHGCKDCAHQKRFRADLINEGAELDEGPNAAEQVAGIPAAGNNIADAAGEVSRHDSNIMLSY